MTISYLSAPMNLKDKFTKFLFWKEKENYVQVQWKQDQKLVCNFDKYSSILPHLDENQWFMYWLQNVENNSLAKYHLTAYLEYNCYWVIRNFLERKNIYLNKLSDTEKYIKALNILRENTINPEKLIREFSKFNPEYSHIQTYSQRWLYNLIRDGIYQEYGIGKYTYWGLLKNTTKTNLKLALSHQGYNPKEIKSFLLLWQCFKEVYNADIQTQKQEKITSPNGNIILRIISLYQSLININPNDKYLTIDHNLFYNIMGKSYQALIDYEKIKRPSAYAYNLPLQSEREENENTSSLTLEKVLFQQQRKEDNNKQNDNLLSLWDKQQLNLTLANTVQKIEKNDFEKKQLLVLYYGLGLKQTHIAKLLNTRQDKISKDKSKITEKILRIFIKEIQTKIATKNINYYNQLGTNLITCPQLNTVSKFIENWLDKYYQQPFYGILKKLFFNLSTTEKKLLKLAYGGNYYLINETNIGLSTTEIATHFQKHQKEIEYQLKTIKNNLQIDLVKYINQEYKVQINYDEKEIINLVEKWLIETPYSLLNYQLVSI